MLFALHFLEVVALFAALIIGAGLVDGVLMMFGLSLVMMIAPNPKRGMAERLLGFLGICFFGAIIVMVLIATGGTS